MRRVNPGFDVYRLTEEHDLLRKSVRAMCDAKIAPRAAEIDATGEFPWDVFAELKRNDLLAIHIPEAYGGAGAGAPRPGRLLQGGAPPRARRPPAPPRPQATRQPVLPP